MLRSSNYAMNVSTYVVAEDIREKVSIDEILEKADCQKAYIQRNSSKTTARTNSKLNRPCLMILYKSN